METKNLSFNECGIKFKKDTTIFGGYASVFNGVDSYGDTIIPGAFSESIKSFGLPKMFLQHESYSLPIGKWLKAEEDSKGLLVEGELTPNLTIASDVKAAIEHETIDGLSIGFLLHKDDCVYSDNGRTINRIAKLVEISVVTFPADSKARLSLKSAIEEIETIRDVERLLRDSGFSKSEAVMLAGKLKSIFGDQKADEVNELAKQRLFNLINRIQNHE